MEESLKDIRNELSIALEAALASLTSFVHIMIFFVAFREERKKYEIIKKKYKVDYFKELFVCMYVFLESTYVYPVCAWSEKVRKGKSDPL